jgi:quercetin dioxygenase-like cupin family protein
VLRPDDILYRRDLGVLCGVLVSTEHLTAATLELGPGEAAAAHVHGGDEVLMALEGRLWVRAWHEDRVHVFELEPEDACYLPIGSRHEYRNAGAGTARAICGIAPDYAP